MVFLMHMSTGLFLCGMTTTVIWSAVFIITAAQGQRVASTSPTLHQCTFVLLSGVKLTWVYSGGSDVGNILTVLNLNTTTPLSSFNYVFPDRLQGSLTLAIDLGRSDYSTQVTGLGSLNITDGTHMCQNGVTILCNDNSPLNNIANWAVYACGEQGCPEPSNDFPGAAFSAPCRSHPVVLGHGTSDSLLFPISKEGSRYYVMRGMWSNLTASRCTASLSPFFLHDVQNSSACEVIGSPAMKNFTVAVLS